MSKRFLLLLSILAVVILSSCKGPSTESTGEPETQAVPTTVGDAPEPEIDAPRVVISEVLTGVEGNNNLEFIELYNAGDEVPFDLQGWAIWYQLAYGQDETIVYRWTERTLVPPNGHYLLVREGQDIGVPADTYFDQPMVGAKGGLQLRATDGTPMDGLVWGTGPGEFLEGESAPAMDNGISLGRSPGGADGNGIDTDNNLADFTLNSTPEPQSTASELTPLPTQQLLVSLEAPENVFPGSNFDYVVNVENQTGQNLHELVVTIQLHPEVTIVANEESISIEEQLLTWNIPSLDDGDTVSTHVGVQAPWTIITAKVHSYYVQASDWAVPGFGGPVHTLVEGGTIPIGTLTDLVGAELTVEGTATMYTGAMYAGTGNVKFYLEDETGGVQVWVPDGEGLVNVALGAKVKAHGVLELYRGALELITNTPDDVEILEPPSESTQLQPAVVDVIDAATDPDLQGRLVQVEGLVTRAEEFTYSFEIDILDESGESITLYVDKQTNMTIELLDVGDMYRVTGVAEINIDAHQIYPRMQEDLEKIFPPVLLVEQDAPNTVQSGETIEVAVTVFNHMPEPVNNLVISTGAPVKGGILVEAMDDGTIDNNQIEWLIPSLDGNGTSATVHYTVQATATDGFVHIGNSSAIADEWQEPTETMDHYVFLGTTVPIWAIQGTGFRSPYVLDPVNTGGVVTGVFPGLEGFWIQETKTDADPLTPAGLFVHTPGIEIGVKQGDSVEVAGVVRESGQQTQVRIAGRVDVTVLSEGNPIPTPIEVNPPGTDVEAKDYYEAIEGMLVQVSAPAVAVGPTSQYGEYVLVRAEHGIDRLWQGQEAGFAIMVDDGDSVTHMDQSTLSYAVNRGDKVSLLVGPLAFTYGRYKIEPVSSPTVLSRQIELPVLSEVTTEEFSLMTWNVENLFDTRDPHPSSPERLKSSEYRLEITKVASTIAAAGYPVVIGMQEVENIGVLEDIAEHELLVGYDYQPALIEGTDSRGIDNGYLVRGDRATLMDVQAFVAPEGLTSRPPLMVEVLIETDYGEVTVFVLNNHFTSMSAGVEATEPRRNAQAAWNITVMEDILGEQPDAYLAVMGDLNSFLGSLPITTLQEAGLVHIFDLLPEEERYSYIFQGASQTLDHILVTESLMALIERVEVLHVNADYGPALPTDDTPLRKSDHDPVVVTFTVGE